MQIGDTRLRNGPVPVPVAELARRRLVEQATELRSQGEVVRATEDAEAVHKTRVATRRLRAALRVFEEVLPPEAADVSAELKWLGGVLGAVRDLDVQIASLRHESSALQAPAEAAEPLVCLFECRRGGARAALLEALDSGRYANLIGALEALIVRPWPLGPRSQAAALPRLIRARLRRLRRAGARLSGDAPPEALHRARIRAKQLRYTLESFADLYGPPARKLIRRAVRMQDVLGEAQDAAVMTERLRDASLPEHGLCAPSVFLLGQLTEVYAQQVRAARTRAPRAYRRVVGKAWRRLRRDVRHAPVPQTLTGCSTSVNTT